MYQGQDVFQLWKRFEQVQVGASLDAMGARAEYLRKGTGWSEIVETRKRMMTLCPDVDFEIAATVSVFNILHLPDFYMDWVSRGWVAAEKFNFSMVTDPVFYRSQILPPRLKDQVRERYSKLLGDFAPKVALPSWRVNQIKGLVKFMDAEDLTRELPRFLGFTQQMDVIRGEDFTQVFPELAELNSATRPS